MKDLAAQTISDSVAWGATVDLQKMEANPCFAFFLVVLRGGYGNMLYRDYTGIKFHYSLPRVSKLCWVEVCETVRDPFKPVLGGINIVTSD